MIKVFHFPDSLDRDMFGKAAVTLAAENFEKSYHPVATVDTDDLDVAYERTNTIHGPWWQNEDVRFHGSATHGMEGSRSTSVGDVLVRGNERWVVASCGFERI